MRARIAALVALIAAFGSSGVLSQCGSPGSRSDFVYLYLGEGIGAAVVNDGQVRRGHTGIAGEVAHVLTAGPEVRRCA